MTTKADISYRGFWLHVTRDGKRRCALKGTPCHRCGGEGCLRCAQRGVVPCDETRDAHHFVPKRRLRTAAAKVDVRNGVCLCRTHHQLVEDHILDSPRPPELEFFLADHGVPASIVPGEPPVLTLR